MTAPFRGLPSRAARLPEGLLERVATPALLVDLDAARRNVARVVALCGGDPNRWRPHLKTTKSPAIWSLLLDAGVRHFKVATTRELEALLLLLAERGVEDGDVLYAQGATPPACATVGDLAARFPAVQVAQLIESTPQLEWLAGGVGGFVDVDPGGRRTGIALSDPDAVVAVARALGPRLRGLHCYEGHLHGPFPARGVALDQVFGELLSLLRRCAHEGLAVREVVTSGTPAFRHVLEREPLRAAPGRPQHRVSPGTVVLHDLRSELDNPELGLEPAAVVLARVVSRPGAGRVTVDAGSKAIAAEAGDPIAVVLGRPDLVGAPCNEEHLPLDLTEGRHEPDPLPERGALLELVPRHVCPTVNLHEVALAVDGEGWREIEIVARAHALFAPATPPTA